MVTPASTPEPRTIVLLGTPFHDLTMEETLERIGRLIRRRTPSYLVTANLDFAAQAAVDVELQRILVEAELVLCDGTPLVWASRLTGKPLRERVAGSDLVPRIAERSIREGWKLFLLGGDPESLQAAVQNLKGRFPGLPACDCYSPPFARFHEMDHAEMVARIRRAKPDILLVAFGCPKQEKWIYAHYRELEVPCCIGVGATIDFLAGKVQRAPAWVGRIGLEWLFRLAQEPRRLIGRYSRDLWFLVSQMLREQKAIFHPPKVAGARAWQLGREEEEFEVVYWKGELLASTIDQLGPPSYKKPFVVDLSRVTRIDSSGLGHLLRTLRRGWASGQAGCFSSPSEAVSGILAATRLDRVVPVAANSADARSLLAKERSSTFLRPIIDPEDSSMLIALPRELVSANSARCSDAVTAEWESRGAIRTLRLDLGATAFMDSSGLGFLIRCHRIVSARPGSRLELLHVPPNVLNVIRVARLDSILNTVP